MIDWTKYDDHYVLVRDDGAIYCGLFLEADEPTAPNARRHRRGSCLPDSHAPSGADAAVPPPSSSAPLRATGRSFPETPPPTRKGGRPSALSLTALHKSSLNLSPQRFGAASRRVLRSGEWSSPPKTLLRERESPCFAKKRDALAIAPRGTVGVGSARSPLAGVRFKKRRREQPGFRETHRP